MTALVLSGLAGLAGAGFAAAVPSARPWLVATVAGAVALETSMLRPRLDMGDDGRVATTWRRAEWIGVVAGTKALQLVTGGPMDIDAELVVAVAVALAVWGWVNATHTDLDGVRRAIELTEGATPLDRIRLRLLSVATAVVVCGLVGTVGMNGLLDLERSPARVWSPWPLWFVVFGLAAVGWVAEMAARSRWDRDGAEVDLGVRRRWARALALWVAALAIVGTVTQPLSTGVTGLPARAITLVGRLGPWPSAVPAEPGSAAPAGVDEDELAPDASRTLPSRSPDAPEWVGDVALAAFVVLVFAYAIARGRHRRRWEGRSAVRGSWSARSLWTALVAAWRALLAALRRAAGGIAAVLARASDAVETPIEPGWRPGDPIRRRIAGAYRRSSEAVAPAPGGRRRPETAREFARRVDDVRFDTVTAVFEEARYSDHVLGEPDAVRAEHATERIVTETTPGASE